MFTIQDQSEYMDSIEPGSGTLVKTSAMILLSGVSQFGSRTDKRIKQPRLLNISIRNGYICLS